MSPDFLPLDVGNRWEYVILDQDGRQLDTFEMEITNYTIIEGVSYYVFSQFQFAGAANQLGVRYDRNVRQYVRFDGERESDLFPAARTSVEVVETDSNDLPYKARFDFGELVLVFERSVGIVEAEFVTENGRQLVKLSGALIGNEPIVGDVPVREAPPLIRTAEPTAAVGEVSEVSLSLQVEAVAEGEEHRFILKVQNIASQLLALDFNSSQDFDFVVRDSVDGDEIWRWSEARFFSAVVRSEAIRPGSERTFEAVWNHRDADLNDVVPGMYQLVGILTTEPPLESMPLEFEVQ
jgi:hypothetical protein